MNVFEPNLPNDQVLALAAAFKEFKQRCEAGERSPVSDIDADGLMASLLQDLSSRCGIPREALQDAGLEDALRVYG